MGESIWLITFNYCDWISNANITKWVLWPEIWTSTDRWSFSDMFGMFAMGAGFWNVLTQSHADPYGTTSDHQSPTWGSVLWHLAFQCAHRASLVLPVPGRHPNPLEREWKHELLAWKWRWANCIPKKRQGHQGTPGAPRNTTGHQGTPNIASCLGLGSRELTPTSRLKLRIWRMVLTCLCLGCQKQLILPCSWPKSKAGWLWACAWFHDGKISPWISDMAIESIDGDSCLHWWIIHHSSTNQGLQLPPLIPLCEAGGELHHCLEIPKRSR